MNSISLFTNNNFNVQFDNQAASHQLTPQVIKELLINKSHARSMEINFKARSIPKEYYFRDNWNLYYEEKLSGTSSDVYLVGNSGFIGIFKPVSHSEGNRAGIPKHEEAIRERIAYCAHTFLTTFMKTAGFDLGIDDFGIPHTELFDLILSQDLQQSHGSYQEFKKMPSLQELSDVEQAAISGDEYMKLCLIDLILLNTDRHLGNVLVGHDNILALIDHGSSLPETNSLGKTAGDFDALTFEWKDLPFTEERIPEKWKDFIREVSIKDLALSMVSELTSKRKLVVEITPNYHSISPEAIFYSMASLYFVKYWIEKAGDEPLRELLHQYIPEQILYRYAKDNVTGEITKIERKPIQVKSIDFKKSVLEWIDDQHDADVNNCNHAAPFVKVIKVVCKNLQKPGQLLGSKRGQPEVTVHTVVAKWEEIEKILDLEFQKIDLTPTLDVAKSKFSQK